MKNNEMTFSEVVEQVNEQDKRDMVLKLGWRLMEATIYYNGSVGYREAGFFGEYEDEIAGTITLDPDCWGEVIEEFGKSDDGRDFIPEDIDDETLDYLFNMMIETAQTKEMEKDLWSQDKMTEW